MAKLELDERAASNIANWILDQPNLPYGLATFAILLQNESAISVTIEEEE